MQDDPVKTRPAQPLEAAQAKNHAALVFLRYAQSREQDDDDEARDELGKRKHGHLVATATAAAAIKVPLPRFMILTARGLRNQARARAAIST